MQLEVRQFPLSREQVSRQLFWYVIEIWWTKPHCVRKRICGADFPESLSVSGPADENVDFVKAVTIEGNGNLVQDDLVVRRLLPKDVTRFLPVNEAMYKDHEQCLAIFLPERDHDASTQQVAPPSPHVLFPYAIRLDENANQLCLQLIMEKRSDSGTDSDWLSNALMPTLARWIEHCTPDKPLRHSLRLIDLETYNQCYHRLKANHGKKLVQIWPERTDPKKFVYEDVAIAAYLITLWEMDRKSGRCNRMQKFVDLGCGNGLLVYLLTSEGYTGCGIDVRKRQIWDLFGSNVTLVERAFEPSDKHLFPDVDWIIGNHSDELTPWIPVIASKSSSTCNFFVIPCCAWGFRGKYQRKDADMSTYRSYIKYVLRVGQGCGYIAEEDTLKIPSTKRACIVGRRNMEIPLETVEKNISALLGDDQERNAAVPGCDQRWIEGFAPRENNEPVRNCSTLPRTAIDDILRKIASGILAERRYIDVAGGKRWNAGGSIPLPDCVRLLNQDELRLLKSQCGGLQTLIRNHRYIFKLEEGKVWIRTDMPKQQQGKGRKHACWFYQNHPDGCPISDESCPNVHVRLQMQSGQSDGE